MELDFFIANITQPNILIPAIRKEWKPYFELKAFKEYDPLFHKVNNTNYRKNKTVIKPTGQTDGNGNPVSAPYEEKVNRIALPLQRLIVARSAAFLTGGGVVLSAQPESETETKLYDIIKKTWKDNKLNFKNNRLARHLMSETECCEIWYSQKVQDGSIEMKCNIYAPSMGYDLMPVWDRNRDLIAFGLSVDDPLNKVRYMDLYTADALRRYKDTGAGWVEIESIPLLYGKIPVIYYCAERSAWNDVQPMIDRLETLISNFADTNDYNGSPILFAKGTITGFATKGEAGKLIESEGDADLKYVTWEGAPEAIKLEIETLLDFIYTCTQTPNISFKEMKGMGGISGVAYDRIMIDAHLKAKESQDGDFGECIQRRINFLISACIETNPGLDSAVDLDITPVFAIFKIDDVAAKVDLAMKANGNQPIMSQKASIEYAGLTDDPQGMLDEIDAEAKAEPPVTE